MTSETNDLPSQRGLLSVQDLFRQLGRFRDTDVRVNLRGRYVPVDRVRYDPRTDTVLIDLDRTSTAYRETFPEQSEADE